MAAAPELLKVVNLIMKRPTVQTQDADVINEKQYRKMAEIDIDDKVTGKSIRFAFTIHYSNFKVFI